jgi:hypothetical protein
LRRGLARIGRPPHWPRRRIGATTSRAASELCCPHATRGRAGQKAAETSRYCVLFWRLDDLQPRPRESPSSARSYWRPDKIVRRRNQCASDGTRRKSHLGRVAIPEGLPHFILFRPPICSRSSPARLAVPRHHLGCTRAIDHRLLTSSSGLCRPVH